MAVTHRKIHCAGCEARVKARLTDGAEVYPHRDDLAAVPFWKCDGCGNHVGTHYRSTDRKLDPLGCIATPKMRYLRVQLHDVLDPLWRAGKIKRRPLYREMQKRLKWKKRFHVSSTRSERELQQAIVAAKEISWELGDTARHCAGRGSGAVCV